jgi:hypothetical protein
MQLLASPNHLFEHLIESELVLARPLCDHPPDLTAMPPQKRRGLFAPITWALILAKQALQITIVRVRKADRVVGSLSFIVGPKSHPLFRQRIGIGTAANTRSLTSQFGHQPIDVLEFV